MNAKAICNCSVAQIFWNYDQLIPNCLGFKIERIDKATGNAEILPAWVGFTSQSNQDWKPKDTSVWPIQKFNWRDLTATAGKTYRYRITPMTGTVDRLKPLIAQQQTTNDVTISPDLGEFKAYFTNGILSTQGLVHYLQDQHQLPNSTNLMSHITVPGDTLRNKLAGFSISALKLLLEKAKAEGGKLYCALYELNDEELIDTLLSVPKNQLFLILSNTPTNESVLKKYRKTSKDLMAGYLNKKNFQYRVVPANHIGHNKFVLYVNASGDPEAVLSGSTNWTVTGLCAQSNNELIIESAAVGKFYKDYWDRLWTDTVKNDSKQGQDLRTADNQVNSSAVGNTTVDIWYSPNTKGSSKGTVMPSDLKEVFELMSAAKQAILFLVFQPGSPSILDQALLCQENNPNLFIRGAATDPAAVDNYETSLYHFGIKTPDTVVAASAVNDQFAYWQKELLKTQGAHAIIHDKIVVIDPFSPNCVVITGSHNLGYKASYCNDENMVIVKGNEPLAAAYATHILDVYDHYRWRFQLEARTGDRNTFFGLVENDSWQKKYFSSKKNQLRQFWATLPVTNGKKANAPIVGAGDAKITAKKAAVKKAKKVTKKVAVKTAKPAIKKSAKAKTKQMK